MVLDFLQIPLTSMRIDRHASCENIVPRIQTSSIAPDSLVINRLHADLINIKLTHTSGQSRAYLPIVNL